VLGLGLGLGLVLALGLGLVLALGLGLGFPSPAPLHQVLLCMFSLSICPVSSFLSVFSVVYACFEFTSAVLT
jgi:hypothetical protein